MFALPTLPPGSEPRREFVGAISLAGGCYGLHDDGGYRSWRLKARATATKTRAPPATLSTMRHRLFAAYAAPPDTNPLPKIRGTLPTRANQSVRLVQSKHFRTSRSPKNATRHGSNKLLALAEFSAHLSTRSGGSGASGAPATNKRT